MLGMRRSQMSSENDLAPLSSKPAANPRRALGDITNGKNSILGSKAKNSTASAKAGSQAGALDVEQGGFAGQGLGGWETVNGVSLVTAESVENIKRLGGLARPQVVAEREDISHQDLIDPAFFEGAEGINGMADDLDLDLDLDSF